jgi:hypothetical protein
MLIHSSSVQVREVQGGRKRVGLKKGCEWVSGGGGSAAWMIGLWGERRSEKTGIACETRWGISPKSPRPRVLCDRRCTNYNDRSSTMTMMIMMIMMGDALWRKEDLDVVFD